MKNPNAKLIGKTRRLADEVVSMFFSEPCDDNLGAYYDEALNQRAEFYNDCADQSTHPRQKFAEDLKKTYANFQAIKKIVLLNRKINYVYA